MAPRRHTSNSMKTKFVVGLALTAAFLGGCVVQSIQPLFSEKEFITYPSLAGTWTQKEEGKELGLWTFTVKDNRYVLKQRDEKGREATFHVAVGKIGTDVFLDFSPDDPAPEHGLNDFMSVNLIPAHVFAKVRKTNDALVLVTMDYEWLEKHLQENPKAIAHILQDKRPVLTATTGELQKFFAKHAQDEKVFKNSIQLVRKDK
jgi:hypothetical protein